MKNKELNNCEDHIEKSLRSSVTTKDAEITVTFKDGTEIKA